MLILVATDFSPRSDRALRRAVLQARTLKAEIRLVHVIDDEQESSMRTSQERAAHALLHKLSSTVSAETGFEVSCEIVFGEAFDGIVRTAETRKADLVVVGAHRRRLLRDVFFGTTAERTIRGSAVPVVMANGVPAEPWRSVLIAVDFSAGVPRVLQTVRDLNLPADSVLTLVHVRDLPGAGLVARAATSSAQIAAYESDELAQAEKELGLFAETNRLLQARRLVLPNRSSIASTILQAAADTQADLIVLGTHGRSPVATWFLGSVVAQTLAAASCDVLAVPASAEDPPRETV